MSASEKIFIFYRTPIDFASASDKIWPHFAALGCKRVSRADLVEKKVLRQVSSKGRRGVDKILLNLI